LHTHAQKTITWDRHLHEYVSSAIETEDSGFFVFTFSPANYPNYYLDLIKLNKYGDEQWRKTIDSDSVTSPISIIRKEPGIYLVLVQGTPPGQYNILFDLIEFNLNGDRLWLKKYGFDSSLFLPELLLPLNGDGYILSGRIYHKPQTSITLSPFKMVVQKFTNGHRMQWADTFSYLNGTL